MNYTYSMNASLQLQIKTTLKLTPKLQAAVRLLRLSAPELEREILDQLEQNPLLELRPAEQDEPTTLVISQEPPNMIEWVHLYTAPADFTLPETEEPPASLQVLLQQQLELTPMTKSMRLIGTTLIEHIDEHGFLTTSPEKLLIHSSSTLAELETVRCLIQQFDPIGCGSLNLEEALISQLNTFSEKTPGLQLSKQIVQSHLHILADHHYAKLMQMYHIDEAQLKTAIQLIKSLQPKPGDLLNAERTEYITPDLILKKSNEKWEVVLNPRSAPHVGINRYYVSLIAQAKNTRERQFLKNNLQEACWFLKSIQNRQENILKVAQFIVDYQQSFFEVGKTAMKPLLLSDVANALHIHESTVSRVTTQKYMSTPRGLFELKYFFSKKIATIDKKGSCAESVRALLSKLIAEENTLKPLSDDKIVKLMDQLGITIARRTIAKYREVMGIPSAAKRISVRNN